MVDCSLIFLNISLSVLSHYFSLDGRSTILFAPFLLLIQYLNLTLQCLYVYLYVPKSKCQLRPTGFCLFFKKNIFGKFNFRILNLEGHPIARLVQKLPRLINTPCLKFLIFVK